MSKIKRLFHTEDGIRISSSFGYRTSPITYKKEFHRGVDYATGGRKLPQYGLNKGTVIRCGVDGTGAIFAEVKFPKLGYVGQYYHLDSLGVVKGQSVDENTIIGYTGSTGNSTGIHLHFGWYPIKDINKSYFNRLWSDFELFDFTPFEKENIGENDDMAVDNKTIHVIKVKRDTSKYDYIVSVDGNKFGLPYDITSMKGFSDKELVKKGWEEVIATNGSVFYPYTDKNTQKTMYYAEGLEKSRGVNNQPLEMNAVSTFINTMAMGFDYSGNIVFDLQKEIQKNLNNYYGAVTGMYGVLKDGEVNTAGAELEYRRFNLFTRKSGRTIWGYNKHTDEYIIISIPGVTGKSGVNGQEIINICKENGCTDAICLDGGGSRWLRYFGEDVVTAKRKVKNSILLYRKKKEVVVEPTPKPQPKPNTPTNEETAIKKEIIKTFRKLQTLIDKWEKEN